ncbi:hypothetical protein D3C76_1309450 [compost metagenome]
MNHHATELDEIALAFDLEEPAVAESGIQFTVAVQARQQCPLGVTDVIGERHEHLSIILQATVDQLHLGIIMLCDWNDDTAEDQVRASVGMKASQCGPADTVGFLGLTDHQDLAIVLQ